MKVKSESEVAQSCLTLSNPWTAAHQAPPSMGFSRQEYWSGLPLPSLKSPIIQQFITHSKDTQLMPGTMGPIEQVYSPFSRTDGLLWRWTMFQ